VSALKERVAGVADRQMPALLVRLCPRANLHDEGLVGLDEVVKEINIERGAEVVRVGHKHVLHAVMQQRVQRSRA
jgi:hypothetical protein